MYSEIYGRNEYKVKCQWHGGNLFTNVHNPKILQVLMETSTGLEVLTLKEFHCYSNAIMK